MDRFHRIVASKTAILLALPLWLVIVPFQALALAGPYDEVDPNGNAKILIHLLSPTTKNSCNRAEALPPCAGIVTAGALYPNAYYAYVLVTDADATVGLAGLQLGIEYDGAPHSGVDIFQWTNCSTMYFPGPSWPESGSGNLMTWGPDNACQRFEPGGPGTGVTASAGYFYLAAYSPDELRVVPRPVDGMAKVADCNAVESLILGGPIIRDPSPLGSARFTADGLTPGYNPCGIIFSPPDCSVSGPDSVAEFSTTTFVAGGDEPGAVFEWSIWGHGQIVGSSTGRSVEVASGSFGTFALQLLTTLAGNSSLCGKAIDVFPTYAYAITGPDYVFPSTSGNVYTVTGAPQGAPLAWSISGDGVITSPIDGPSIQVTAGDPGSFRLSVEIGGTNPPAVVHRSVMVVSETCGFYGPMEVYENSSDNHYHATTVSPSHSWSITGSGSIVGRTDLDDVRVQAGSAGSYTLTLTTAAGHCEHTVTVKAAPPCLIEGLEILPAGMSSDYTARTSHPDATFNWSVSGNAAITFFNGADVRVNAGAAGAFTLSVVVTASGVSETCTKDVQVVPEPGPSSNQNAKVLIHLAASTSRDVCSGHLVSRCSEAVTVGNLFPDVYFAHVLVADAFTDGESSGVSGMQFGISYDAAPRHGVDIFDWHTCASTEYRVPGWPASGTGNMVQWLEDCQNDEPGGPHTGVVAHAGYFYLAAYTPDVLSITATPLAVKVVDCASGFTTIEGAGIMHEPSHLGAVAFGGGSGYNPCRATARFQRTTWSHIKSLYH